MDTVTVEFPGSSTGRRTLLDRAGLYEQADELYDRLKSLKTVCPDCRRPVSHPDVIKYGRTTWGFPTTSPITTD